MRPPARITASLAATLLGLTLVAACGDDSESNAGSDGNGGTSESGGCVGETSGDVTLLATGPVALPGGGSAGVGSVESDEDPPVLNLLLGGGSESEQEDATELEVGDTFTFEDTTYTVQGFCEDKAYLAQSGG